MQDATMNTNARGRPADMAGRARLLALSLIAPALVTLAACSGSSGADTAVNPAGPTTPNTGYNGPAPATADIQSFKINLYDNIRSTNRCGACHSVEGGQTPMFARSDDVNLAYADANGVVTLTSPSEPSLAEQCIESTPSLGIR